jgi:hypothetical protein
VLHEAGAKSLDPARWGNDTLGAVGNERPGPSTEPGAIFNALSHLNLRRLLVMTYEMQFETHYQATRKGIRNTSGRNEKFVLARVTVQSIGIGRFR